MKFGPVQMQKRKELSKIKEKGRAYGIDEWRMLNQCQNQLIS